jgi:hypothetical protein
MSRTGNQSDGFASLTWRGADTKTDGSDPRASLSMSLLQDRRLFWGGDCCDDGCENGG